MNLWTLIKGLLIQDETDRSKELSLEVNPGSTTGKRMTVTTENVTDDRTIVLPDTTDTVVTEDYTQTLNNKTMDFSSGGNNTLTADAVDVVYDNTSSGLTATDTQAAIDEVEGRLDTAETSLSGHLDGGASKHDATEIDYEVLDGQKTDIDAASDDVELALGDLDDFKLSTQGNNAMDADLDMGSNNITSVGTVDGRDVSVDGTKLDGIEANAKDDQDADEVPYDNSTSGLTATEVQSAVDEVEGRLDTVESSLSSKANVTLNNLTSPTAINQDLIFNKLNPIVKSQDNGAGNTENLIIESGNAVGGDSGSLNLRSGTATGTRGSIDLDAKEVITNELKSGLSGSLVSSTWGTDIPGIIIDGTTSDALSNAAVGIILNANITQSELLVATADQTGATGSSSMYFYTGLTVDGNSGDYWSESGTASGTGNSGNVFYGSGNANGTGNSGNVRLRTGNSAGGTRGKIQFVDGSEGYVGHVWTQTEVNGSGAWQAVPSAGANTNLSNLSSPTDINQDLTFDNASSKNISIEAETISGVGKSLTVTAGSSFGTDQGYGSLTLSTGSSTGNVNGAGITFKVAPGGAISGSSSNTPQNTVQFNHTQTTTNITQLAPFGSGGSNVVASLSSSTYIVKPQAQNTASTSVGLDLTSADNNGTGGSGSVFIASGAKTSTGNSGLLQIKSGNHTGTGNTGELRLRTGDATAGNSGNIDVTTGTASGTRGTVTINAPTINSTGNFRPTTDIIYNSGDAAHHWLNVYARNIKNSSSSQMEIGGDPGFTGGVLLYSGTMASASSSGFLTMRTGQNSAGPTGQVNLHSGNSTGDTSGTLSIFTGTGNSTGAISITTGAASSGNSGALTIQTGTASGTRGNVVLAANKVDASTSTGALRVPNLAADPGTPTNGDIWYNTTSNELKAHVNSVTVVLA